MEAGSSPGCQLLPKAPRRESAQVSHVRPRAIGHCSQYVFCWTVCASTMAAPRSQDRGLPSVSLIRWLGHHQGNLQGCHMSRSKLLDAVVEPPLQPHRCFTKDRSSLFDPKSATFPRQAGWPSLHCTINAQVASPHTLDSALTAQACPQHHSGSSQEYSGIHRVLSAVCC